ncbi:uncharacterized protein [Rutidosis leptorrhynchoides]|uniref:uncharacterized protein n=1 Tax=Rutidosis leptorrhynchoides TaxID=125765 RepID=UPI003A9970C9
MISAIEGQTHTFQFHYDPQSKRNFPQFIVDRLLDEPASQTVTTTTPGATSSSTQPSETGTSTAPPSSTTPPPSIQQLQETDTTKEAPPGQSARRALFVEDPSDDNIGTKRKRD